MVHTMAVQAMERALDTAVIETLETMFFASAVPVDSAPHHATGTIRTVIEFRGDAEGIVEVSLTRDKACELAANFLGLDTADVSDAQVESVCGELANMVCGAMVSIADPDGHFVLNQPFLSAYDSTVSPCPVVKSYDLDAELLQIGLHCTSCVAGES